MKLPFHLLSLLILRNRHINVVAMLPRISAPGIRLSLSEYQRDFNERMLRSTAKDSWKIERMQEFDEAGFPSWDAFLAGDWNRSLMLYEHVRDELRTLTAEYTRHGAAFHRIRVVEQPITPYLQWELNVFLVRTECGERIRVIDAGKINSLEAGEPLREHVSLGGSTLYHVMYTNQHAPDGAMRYDDPEAVAEFEKFAKELYSAGEDFLSYFDREIKSLPPPVRQRA